MTKTLRHTTIALAVLAALTAVVGAGAGTTRAHGPELSVRWQAPTPRDGPRTRQGRRTAEPRAGRGARLRDSESATAGRRRRCRVVRAREVHWTPSAAQVGEHMLTFAAQKGSRYARPRSFLVYVLPATPAGPHDEFPLGGINGMSRAARSTRASTRGRARAARAKKLIRIPQYTPEGTLNVVQTLSGVVNQNGEYWVRIRLPMLPNGRTGWVPRRTIGPYNEIWTHLVIDRKLFTATLYRKGRAIFTTRIGVGKPYWPTPAGEFYVRERITGFSDPIYGPIAFGTNARSNVLTDWPGGGFIGIHGTNQPEILPGRVSHGCVRMPNAAVLRLARLMPLGTPVTIF